MDNGQEPPPSEEEAIIIEANKDKDVAKSLKYTFFITSP